MLWFPELFTQLLPGWIINLAHVVHSEEALLAVGFIFTIHFFNSHLRPDKFPFDDVIFTGRESTEEIAHERPRQMMLLTAEGHLDEKAQPPMASWLRRVLVSYGWIAFGLGMILLVFILLTTVL